MSPTAGSVSLGPPHVRDGTGAGAMFTQFVHYYHTKRSHRGLDYRTPTQVETGDEAAPLETLSMHFALGIGLVDRQARGLCHRTAPAVRGDIRNRAIHASDRHSKGPSTLEPKPASPRQSLTRVAEIW